MADNNQSLGGFSQEEEEWIKKQREREAERQKRQARRQDESSGDVNINSLMDIMVIMLVFLLKSYGEEPIRAVGDDLKVPQSTSQLEPADTMTITISRAAIRVNDSTVVDVQEGEVDPSHYSGDGEMRIDPLLDKLDEAIEQERSEAEMTGEEYEPEATVIADQTTPHRLILEVLYTATEAELAQFRFAVIQSTGEAVGDVDQVEAEI